MLPSTGRPFGPGGSFWVDTALHPQEALDGGGELLYLLVGVLAFLYGLPDAVLDVVLEQDGAHLLKRRDDAGNLGEDVHAVGLLVHHPLHAPHLTLDPLEAVLDQLFVSGLYVAVGAPRPRLLVVMLCCIHLLVAFLLANLHPA